MAERFEYMKLASADTVPRPRRPLAGRKEADEHDPGHRSHTLPFDPEHPASAVGMRLGRYHIDAYVGRGASSLVFKAFDATLARPVALKLLTGWMRGGMESSALVEARALAKLSHPNVVQVYEVSVIDGVEAIVMEYVEGHTLLSWQRDVERPWKACVDVYIQVGRGLAAAHGCNIVHRDFKPGNALTCGGAVKVVDFGLAQAVLHSDAVTTPGDSSNDSTMRTEPRRFVEGTPAYMAPEQALGESVGPAADQFSFCTALFEAIYGYRPFPLYRPEAVVEETQRGPIFPSSHRERVPARLQKALARGLARDPEARWPSMDALLDELAALQGGRYVWWLFAPVVAVCGLGLAWALSAAAPTVACNRGPDEDSVRVVVEELGGRSHPDAAGMAKRVGEALDAWQQAQVGVRATVCAAKSADIRERSARLACLDERERDFNAAADVLRRLGRSEVPLAMEVALGIPSPHRCLLDRLPAASGPVHPMPEDPADRARVHRAQALLPRLNALMRAQKALLVRDLATDELLVLGNVDYPPVVAALHERLGTALVATSDFEGAERELRRAYAMATELGDAEVAAQAAIQLGFTLGSGAGQHSEGLAWIDAIAPQLERLDDAELRMSAVLARAHLRFDMHDIKAAADEFETLMELAKGDGEPNLYRLADAHAGLGIVALDEHDFVAAAAHQREALALFQAAVGPTHPEVAYAKAGLASSALALGELAEAERLNREVLDTWTRAYGPSSLSVAGGLINLGAVLLAARRPHEAERAYSRALKIAEDTVGLESDYAATIVMNLAIVDGAMFRYEEAIERYEDVREFFAAQYGPNHPPLATALEYQAAMLHALRRVDEAEPLLRRAHEMNLATLGPDHARVADTLHGLGVVQPERGFVDEASALAEQAFAIKQETLGSSHPITAHTVMLLAQVAARRRETAKALRLAKEALNAMQSADVPRPELAEAKFTLAQAIVEADGDRERAMALAREAANDGDGTRFGEDAAMWLAGLGA